MPAANLVADPVARVLQRAVAPKLKPELRFDEIPGRMSPTTVATRHGPVACTIYRPADSGNRPAVYVNVHGGGFVLRHPEQDDPWCRYLADRTGVVVVNVDYDTAPDVRFPVPVEQVYDVVSWAARQDEWDGSRLGVGGQSAGGALAAAASRLALDNGGPRIALQLLHYAPLDLVTPAAEKLSPIKRPVLRPWMAKVFDAAYVPRLEDRRHPMASPAWGANCEGLEGIAPALVVTCEHDLLRAEGVDYARALDRVGALREHCDVPGTDHGYNIMRFGTREKTEPMYEFLAEHVRRALS